MKTPSAVVADGASRPKYKDAACPSPVPQGVDACGRGPLCARVAELVDAGDLESPGIP